MDLYRDEICESNGKISFERPKTVEIHYDPTNYHEQSGDASTRK